MSFFEVVQASVLFVMIIVFTVLIGILFTEIFKRKKYRDVIYLIIALFAVLVRIIVDTYWDFSGYQYLILGKEGLFLDFILFGGLFLIFYKLWKRVDKIFIFSIIGFFLALVFSSFSLISLTPIVLPTNISLFLMGAFVGFLQSIFVIIIFLSFYFLVIKFLVDNPRGTDE